MGEKENTKTRDSSLDHDKGSGCARYSNIGGRMK
jgi:hypothetical protein